MHVHNVGKYLLQHAICTCALKILKRRGSGGRCRAFANSIQAAVSWAGLLGAGMGGKVRRKGRAKIIL